MSLDKYFCSSPWFHVRINNQGRYEYCRWAPNAKEQTSESVITFFQQGMSQLRQELLSGNPVDICSPCYEMEKHNKVSGRQKQLLKTGVTLDNFEKTMLSSPWIDEFARPDTQLLPQDWQIDLGNYCNSSCVYCYPEFSSLLANDLKKVGIIEQVPPNSWCNDPVKLATFIDDLCAAPKLQYLHFLGGETLITPAFKTILEQLVQRGRAEDAIVGFTTNLSVWDDSIIELLGKFKNVHVGLSVDALSELNDYARYPSSINTLTTTLDKWVKLANQKQWLAQLRTTPTWLTVRDLTTVYDYAWANNLIVESCNFLQNPDFLRMTVLPQAVRNKLADSMDEWLAAHTSNNTGAIINIRNPETAKDLICQDLASYINYLRTGPDESTLMPKAVAYLKKLESLRGNSVLDYLPEYEDILRAAGY